MSKNSLTIGVFDSGIGGLSILKSLAESRYFGEIIYYGDTARAPYGVKDSETIVKFSLEALDFFNRFSLDMLVVACNTVSAHALPQMQANATYPIIGVIESGVLSLSHKVKNRDENILIIGTKATIESGIYEAKLRDLGYDNVSSLQTGLFVPLVEEGIFSGALLRAMMEHYFAKIPAPNAIILGCTHFPFIQDEIAAYFHHKPILIHSGEAIVEHLTRIYSLKECVEKPKIRYFSSSNTAFLESTAKAWLGGNL